MEEKMLKIGFLLTLGLFVSSGCGVFRSKQVVQNQPERKISNPFQNAENDKKHDGIVVKRSYGLNSIEVLLPDSQDDSIIRYPLAELKKDELPDASKADAAVLKSKLSKAEIPAKETELNKIESSSEGEKPADDGTVIAKAKKPEQSQSYLLGIAKVKDLYKKNQFELALVHLEPLVELYPEDVRLLSLRGTIADKLGFKELAKESWATALKIEPNNYSIRTALNRVQGQTQSKKVTTESNEKINQ